MHIDSDLDGGNIEVISARDPSRIELAMRRDANAAFMQWFHFRVRGARGTKHRYRIVNAGEATYPDAFEGYRACASYGDSDEWFRVPTEFDGSSLSFIHTAERDEVRFAYFAPYPWARHERLLARASTDPEVSVEQIGTSLDGRAMSLLRFGEPDEAKRNLWIVARQHPGETMAEWFMEGVLDRLLDRDDELARALRERAVFHLVPNMNPDGGVRGHLRTNAAGVDLNRSWAAPTESSPEVACVREQLFARGVDLFLDVHGDERNPYVFAAGCEGNPDYSERIDALEELFMSSLCDLDPDFQREYGYDRDPPGEGDLRTAGNWAGETFDCLSLVLEMPFKDDANHPDPKRGWSPARARGFGRSTLESVMVCMDSLR